MITNALANRVWAMLSDKINVTEDSVIEVASQRGYLKPEMLNYLAENKLVLFNSEIEMKELMDLVALNWDDGVEFILKDRVVVPIRNAEGELLTLVGWRKSFPKYLTLPSPMFNKNIDWFNIDRALTKAFDKSSPFYKSIVVVEGIFDALTLDCYGIPAIATMGSDVGAWKGALLSIFDNIICIPDNDGVGKKAPDRWKVPMKSKFVYFNSSKIDYFGRSLELKDVDLIFNHYDTQTLKTKLLGVIASPKKLEVINL